MFCRLYVVRLLPIIINFNYLIQAIQASPDKFMVYPKSTDPHRPFSTIETTTGTKLSPNGAAIRQWETRSWISTIPLQKAASVDDSRSTKSINNNVINNKHHTDPETGSASTTPPSSHDENFDYSESKYLPSSFRDTDPRDPSNYPIIESSSNITHHSAPSESPKSRASSLTDSECKGDGCRKSPFQGTYDTINYQKKMVYPGKQSTRVDEPSHSRRFRSEDNYSDDGGHHNSGTGHHSRYHHSSEPVEHNDEKDSHHSPKPHHLTWHHHAHPKGRSSRWESDMKSLGSEDGNDSSHDWNRKEWRDRPTSSNRDSFGYTSKSHQNAMDEGEENVNRDDNHYHQRDHHQTRRRKYNNNDTKDESRPGAGRDHYEYDRREYENERDRGWKSYLHGRNDNDNGNHESNYANGKSDDNRWKSGKDELDNESRSVDKSEPSREHHGDSNNVKHHHHHHQYHHRSYDSNGNGNGSGSSRGGNGGGKPVKSAEKSKPKVRTYHHDEETPDGYSHAHGYEKEEVEGSRFFEPSGLTGHDNKDHHTSQPAPHYIDDYGNINSHNNGSDEYRRTNHYQNTGHDARGLNNRNHGKSKQECDCSGRGVGTKSRVNPELIDDAAAKSRAASAARVKRQDESIKTVFGLRSSGFSGQKLKISPDNATTNKS